MHRPDSSARAAVSALLGVIALAAIITAARAEPFRPANPDLVLLRVGPAGADGELVAQERRYRDEPPSMANALALAAAHIDRGRRAVAARNFGRAETILESLRANAGASAEWHVLLADLHQYRHDYARAVALLDRALQLDSAHVRARLMRAAIRQTRGEFALAQADCAALLAQGESALGIGCLAQVKSLTGQLDAAHALLQRQLAVDRERATNVAVRIWMLSALADMAERRGEIAAAERLLREALRLEPQNQFIRLTLADLLLGQGRPADVEFLLQAQPATQSVLLRRAEARRSSGADAREIIGRLQQTMAEGRERGERIDGRDVTRLLLLEARGCDALAAARENWRSQREPSDVRLLLRAAHACGKPEAAGELAEWRIATRYQDAQADVLDTRIGQRT